MRPVLFRFNPEIVHERMTRFGAVIGQSRFLRKLTRLLIGQRPVGLEKTIAGITFPSPIGLAAGFDYRAQLPWTLEAWQFGFASVGTITYSFCPGNSRPWLGRLVRSKSLLVNKGFKNDGIKQTLPRLVDLPAKMPVGLSLGQTNSSKIETTDQAIADIVRVFRYAETHQHSCSYYELNISCPNIQKNISLYEPKNLRTLLKELESLDIQRPIFIKCPISITDEEHIAIAETAKSFSDIKGLIIGNLQKDRHHPTLSKEEVAKCGEGNFSGIPTRERSIELIRLTRQRYQNRYAIIGCGGVFSAHDAREKFAAGADLVQLITGLVFYGPQLVAQINKELAISSEGAIEAS